MHIVIIKSQTFLSYFDSANKCLVCNYLSELFYKQQRQNLFLSIKAKFSIVDFKYDYWKSIFETFCENLGSATCQFLKSDGSGIVLFDFMDVINRTALWIGQQRASIIELKLRWRNMPHFYKNTVTNFRFLSRVLSSIMPRKLRKRHDFGK